jgi:cytochrome c553
VKGLTIMMTATRMQAARAASVFTIALFAALALSACSGSESATNAEAAQAEAPVQKPASASLPSGNAAAGEKLANTKMGANNQACTECHGAQGNHPNAEDRPKIGGQYQDYIEHALQAYRAGDRTNVFMVGQAKALSDQQIADLAAYFSSQPSELNNLSHLK